MPETIPRQRLAILGLGKMGSILMQAFRRQNVVQAENISATVQHPERAAVTVSGRDHSGQSLHLSQ